MTYIVLKAPLNSNQPTLRNHTRDLYQFLCMLPMAVARSSNGVVVIRYVLPVFVDDVMFLFNNGLYSGMNFAVNDQFWLNLLIYLQSLTELIFVLLKRIILTNYFEITRKLTLRMNREI